MQTLTLNETDTMQTKKIEIDVEVLQYEELTAPDRELIDVAKEATKSSFAPYSRFNVGAAVRLENGVILHGSNQENSAYPSGLCAERVTIFYANAHYPDIAPRTLAIATFAGGDFLSDPITPCGACRQVLIDCEKRYGKDIAVLLFGKKYIYKVKCIRDLMPLAFDEESLV